MENASKAIIIAGGILTALIIVSMLVIVFTQIGGVYSEKGESLTIEQLEEYNKRFAIYNNTSGLYGSELLSLANLVADYNYRILYDEGIYDENGNYTPENGSGTFYEENKFEIYVTFDTILPATDDEGNIIYKGLKKRENVDISVLKNYNDGLEQTLAGMRKTDPDYNNTKSLLTEIRSLPFVCDTTRTKYNKYGRISKMYFEQATDKDILDLIFKK